MRKEVDKAHKELKGSEKPKLGRNNNTPNPMQEMVSKEAGRLLYSKKVE